MHLEGIVKLASSYSKPFFFWSLLKSKKRTFLLGIAPWTVKTKEQGQHSKLQMNVSLPFVMLDEDSSGPESFSPATEFVHPSLLPVPSSELFDVE